MADSVQKSSGPLQVDIARSAGSVLGLSLTTSIYRNKQVITIQKIKPASVADRWGQPNAHTNLEPNMHVKNHLHTYINKLNMYKSMDSNFTLNNYSADPTEKFYKSDGLINQPSIFICQYVVSWLIFDRLSAALWFQDKPTASYTDNAHLTVKYFLRICIILNKYCLQ